MYIFQDKATGAVLYIGEAHSQDLKQRITQNFAPNDTGGTFRKDWCDKEKKEFTQFKEALQHWLIRAILIETESKDLIRAIEETFISELKPKYNKFVGRPSVG
ncbi:GIY-YIG nuclease family protein [Candidatus Thiodictyon syntrophicum]|uniref:GIY-YIG nuclease family protein n=1 Tax=Candidatus Thiodictyon syntrophicum TaxID=1166950 RepID=UPI0012FD03CF|nr:GIY-YIG nuclease family protein [Candidatus Thiodictyon syntrophicum]